MATESEHLVNLTSFPTEMEASTVVAALERNGVKATATGGFTAGFRAEAPGWVQVMVVEEDLDRAREILAEVQQEITDIDWSQVDVGEPEDADE